MLSAPPFKLGATLLQGRRTLKSSVIATSKVARVLNSWNLWHRKPQPDRVIEKNIKQMEE